MATIYHNPALHEEPRSQKTSDVPPRAEQSMLRWLESQGRLIGPESPQHQYYGEVEPEEELEELSETSITYGWQEEEEELELEE
jgi:Protein of unknown function (DUF3134)